MRMEHSGAEWAGAAAALKYALAAKADGEEFRWRMRLVPAWVSDRPGARAVEAGTPRGLPARSDQRQFTGHPQTFGIPFPSTPQLLPPVQSVPSWQ